MDLSTWEIAVLMNDLIFSMLNRLILTGLSLLIDNFYFKTFIYLFSFVARLCSGFLQIQNQNCPGIGSGIMGGDFPKADTRGVYFLQTNNRSPFARG